MDSGDHFPARKTRAGSHSCVIAPHLKDLFLPHGQSKYGRMFTDLPSCPAGEARLVELGRPSGSMDAAANGQAAQGDNPRIPGGWPVFGQFIAHDITADRSLLTHHANFASLQNFRTPSLDLEAVYASGPSGNPYLYDLDDSDKFLIGVNDEGKPDDVPRNRQGRALVSDARNDVHLLISQLHLAFLKFHNRIVDLVRELGADSDDVFAEARRIFTWHYQWIVAHEFLPLMAGEALVTDVLENGCRFYHYDENAFIPVEFADAAYRFGHSQIRAVYDLNGQAKGTIFPDFGGTRPIPASRTLDWRLFFAVDPAHPPQPSKRLDTFFAHSLIDLPTAVVGETSLPEERSLAYRDLERGRALDLPSGEDVARAMGVAPLSSDEIGGGDGATPLFYYILKEAEVRHNGEQLGEVGGRIVAEVLIGILDGDSRSYRRVNPDWQPELPAAEEGTFTIADLLRFAEVV